MEKSKKGRILKGLSYEILSLKDRITRQVEMKVCHIISANV
jgi:hypothetical protein